MDTDRDISDDTEAEDESPTDNLLDDTGRYISDGANPEDESPKDKFFSDRISSKHKWDEKKLEEIFDLKQKVEDLPPTEAKDINASAFRLFTKQFDNEGVIWKSNGIAPLNLKSRDPDEERDPHYVDTIDMSDPEQDVDLNKVDFSDSAAFAPGAPDEFEISAGRYESVNDTRGILIDVISRAQWDALPRHAEEELLKPKIKYIHMEYYTRDGSCTTKEECKKAVREIQRSDIYDKGLTDIAHNFLIGGDGNVYEGRGWYAMPEPTNELEKYHGRYLQLAYIGDYRDIWEVERDDTEQHLKAKWGLIQEGVELKYLSDEFKFC